jgi:hypothetical protein
VDDELGAALERRVRTRVHVTDDHVRPVAGLQQRVGAAVDSHQQRLVLRDVGTQRFQVRAVVVAADHYQNVPALDLGSHVRHPDALQEQLLLDSQILHCVGGEGLDLVSQSLPGEGQLMLQHLSGDQRSLRDDMAVGVQQLVTVDNHLVALVEKGEDVLARVVDELYPGGQQDARAQIRIAAGD